MPVALVKSFSFSAGVDLSGTGAGGSRRPVEASYRSGHTASSEITTGDFPNASDGFVYRWTPTAIDQLIRFWDFDDADGMKFAEYTVTSGYLTGNSERMRGMDGGKFVWSKLQVLDIRKVLLDDGEFDGSFLDTAAGTGDFHDNLLDKEVTVTLYDCLTIPSTAVSLPLGYALTKLDPEYSVTSSTDLMLSVPNTGDNPFGWAVDITLIGKRA